MVGTPVPPPSHVPAGNATPPPIHSYTPTRTRDHPSPLRFTCLHAHGTARALLQFLRLRRAFAPPPMDAYRRLRPSHPRVYAWNINEALETCKHLLQHTTETTVTFRTYACNIRVKHIQHPYQTLTTFVRNR
jgi:hypothetical protein